MRDTVALRMPSGRQPWWQHAVLYQIYVRSFADSNGDGVGDLPGIVERLDYLKWLGVDAVWLSPITVSPDKDWGYDVADYVNVQPVFGGLDAFDELVAEAGRRDIRVVIDLVPNHTSDQHEWFWGSRGSRDAGRRDWYVWRDPKPDGSPPNNWISAFGGGPAWTLDSRTGQMYQHSFLPEQPDLNWWNEEVRDTMDDVMRFWLDRGVAGFRLDVAHAVVKDRDLRDVPPGADTNVVVDLEETFAVLRRWRKLVDAYEGDRILLGETWVMDLERLASFYGSGADQLHLAFNFPFAFAPLEAGVLRDVVERTEELLPRGAWPAWTLSNHDIVRFPTRMAGNDERKARAALLTLLTQRGTPVLYNGDELAMRQVDVPPDRLRDMADRDGARTPLPWNGAWEEPWLPPGGDVPPVAAQREDPDSFLSFCRELIARRRSSADLQDGAYETLASPPGVWAYRRGEHTAVAINLTGEPAEVDLDGARQLAPWEGVVLDV
jgi:alpha-glucosidase